MIVTVGLTLAAVLAAYLIGAIPFAYVVVRAVKGIDIRTVGSGNVGATNAGRVLGLPYFFLIFFLDVAKGYLPTLLLPRLVEQLAPEHVVGGLPILVGLAAILGHNFPVYLKFRGGKGVATSLGAFLALDPVACGGAFVTFLFVFALTRYVSMSSVAGALGFAFVHFATVEGPLGRDQALMSAVTLVMVALMIVRHRKNFARIAAGTEPKVPLGGRRRKGG